MRLKQKEVIPIPNELKPYLENQMQKAREAGVMILFFTPTTKKKFYDADKLCKVFT